MANNKINSIIADFLHFSEVTVQHVPTASSVNNNCQLDVLRIDLLHPVVSGNKWFKLQFYLQQATQYSARNVATFGGAYSNHIVAAAFACHILQIPCKGFIRGDVSQTPSHTLLQAQSYGMELIYLSREDYKHKEKIQQQYPDFFWINEGGYGSEGAHGAESILHLVPDIEKYTHIIAAVGTGTMLAGLIRAAQPHQHIIGISAMKGNTALSHQIQLLLKGNEKVTYSLFHDYHFGGYGKHPVPLLEYISHCWQQYQLPLDIVYTGKAFYATDQLMQAHTIPPGSNVLFIHSGGLQGNLSLPSGTLPFS